jgi:hypothetical protein
VAALCAQVDNTGNPNQAPAGTNWPFQYIIGFTENYAMSDIQLLNAAGVNAFNTVNGVLCLYGFSTPVLPANDTIFWQASHSRLRMWLVATFQTLAQGFMFQQIDGNGNLLNALGGALSGELTTLYQVGALYGASAAQAFSVNVGAGVNPPTQLALGIVSAQVDVAMSPFAQSIQLTLTSVPITQSL